MIVVFCTETIFITIGNLFAHIIPTEFILVLLPILLIVWLRLIGEIKTKMISLDIEEDSVIVRRYLGFGPAKIYGLGEITGFKISVLTWRGGSYEYLYLMEGDRKIAKLSDFYHNNYKELKRHIISLNIKSSGFEAFSNRQEIKDIFNT